jgi:hypothetical protein
MNAREANELGYREAKAHPILILNCTASELAWHSVCRFLVLENSSFLGNEFYHRSDPHVVWRANVAASLADQRFLIAADMQHREITGTERSSLDRKTTVFALRKPSGAGHVHPQLLPLRSVNWTRYRGQAKVTRSSPDFSNGAGASGPWI